MHAVLQMWNLTHTVAEMFVDLVNVLRSFAELVRGTPRDSASMTRTCARGAVWLNVTARAAYLEQGQLVPSTAGLPVVEACVILVGGCRVNKNNNNCKGDGILRQRASKSLVRIAQGVVNTRVT